MESFVTPQMAATLKEYVKVAKGNPKVEVECKLLSGLVQTKDVADRIIRAAESISFQTRSEEPYMTLSYPGDVRVTVKSAENIHKVCMTNSLRGIPLTVEKKEKYGGRDVLDIPDISARFTVRTETQLKKDSDNDPNDSKAFVRVINRKSYMTRNNLFQIDISMVKSKDKTTKTIASILRQQHKYEVEIEFIDRATKLDEGEIVNELLKIVNELSKAYYQTPFLLSVPSMERYSKEFDESGHVFYNIVTMMRKHIRIENPYNVTKGYTVTNKADGERSGLYVSKDLKVLKITANGKIVWTGITANSSKHAGDFVDGEFIPEKNLFCIFDVYRFRNKDVKGLPLMTTDDEMTTHPLSSRLGCANEFVNDLRMEFTSQPSLNPMRIETKLFMAGDGPAMEQAIQTMLAKEFEYETDGLIFTPRDSPVAPKEDLIGRAWVRVYKWKPETQNSIDFLLRFTDDPIKFDPILKKNVREGELFVSRTAGDVLLYPRETMNGEYVPRQLPADLQRLASKARRIPSFFQPGVPQAPDAYRIYLPVNDRGISLDEDNQKVETNTIVECAYDLEMKRWNVMRTRYDKTYQLKVLKKQNYGNDVDVANNIWTSIHVPVSKDMISNLITNPIDEVTEDDSYYREDIKRNSRVFTDVYNFHNHIKFEMYKAVMKPKETHLELAAGSGGDLFKIIDQGPSKIVTMDLSLPNIISPIRGAAFRYLEKKKDNPRKKFPPVLLLQGDMTQNPLFSQEDKYMPILMGTQTGSTPYLKNFDGLNTFDTVGCQFALHYACKSEEMFMAFAQNLKDTCKGRFLGTCSDGKSIYSLLLGKKQQIFGSKIGDSEEYSEAGRYTKEYEETGTWEEDAKFGMGVSVLLESFEQPQVEYLVPFEKIIEIMSKHGFDLKESKLFDDWYSGQIRFRFNDDQKAFSFLNRSFVFERREEEEEPEPEEEEEEEPEEEEEEEEEEGGAKKKEPEPKKEEEKPKKKVLKKKDPEPEPILFLRPDESGGEWRNFSNMSDHKITINDEEFKTVEHFFQAQKAKIFKDDEMYAKIQKAKTSKAAKALGQKVKDFNQDTWEFARDDIMKEGVRAKFVQHPSLRKQLVDTGDRMIGEANPRDMYWGIGTSMYQVKSKSPSKWRGQNKMGRLLMKMRDDFKSEA
jgi:ribA/ribD-fused uncharacterized protein